ncbi:hypothetical protein ACGFT2_33700 [Streptomyces sp. NPDC048514]|uniref:hypothetical protein n=1 Tax=Streptomyces sp. NPDC048514 TaxID=3365564 RepID=UPI0037163B50
MTSDLRKAMEVQKRTIKTIGGEPPEIAYASAVDFPSARGAMRLTAIDPDEAALDAVDLPVDPDRHVLAYYAPFLDAFAHQQPQLLGDYVVAGFVTIGATLGVLAPVLQRVERAHRREAEVRGLRNDILRLLARHAPRRDATLHSDGTLFAVDWTLPRDDRLRRAREDRPELPDILHRAYRGTLEGDPWPDESAEEGDFAWRDLPRASGPMPGIFPLGSGDLLEG